MKVNLKLKPPQSLLTLLLKWRGDSARPHGQLRQSQGLTPEQANVRTPDARS